MAPAAVLDGWTMKASLAAGPYMVKALLVAPVRPALEATSVYPTPTLLMLRSLKVATPATALTGVVPVNVPPTGLVPIAIPMEAVEVVTVLPAISWTVTLTAGEITVG